jgi:cupin fold WbuC family metalloprotein
MLDGAMPMKTFSTALFDDLAAKAAAGPRRRAHFNIHEQPSDLVQRFFVVALRDAYFRPHRHLARSELALLLQGRIAVLTFDDAGRVISRDEIGEGTGELGYETPRAQWHTLIVMSDTATFLEVKEGPYDPATAVEFAPWAPTEGAPEVPRFLESLRGAKAGDSFA